MARFKTPIKFRGIKEEKTFEKNEEFEMTIERSKEVLKNLKENHDIDIEFERLDKPESKDTKKDDEEAK